MKLFTLIFLSLFGSMHLSIQAQNYHVVTGKVEDRKTNQPLPYANISVANTSLGTFSNNLGEFEFHIPDNYRHDTLVISYLGYQSYKAVVESLRENETQIFGLEETPAMLNEIVVSADAAKQLVKKALHAIPFVYSTAPYLMEGFHRSWEKVDFTDSISYPGTLIEAAVTIYDPGYIRKKSKEEIYITEIRRSAMMEFWNYGKGSALSDLLDRNLVKYSAGPAWIFLKSFLHFPNDLTYEWEGTTIHDGESLSIIRVEAANDRGFPAQFKVYISEDDYTIIRFDLFGLKKEIDFSIGPWHTEYFDQTYIFKRYEKKVYLSHVKKHYIIKNLDPGKKKVLRTEEYYRELLINQIITTDVESIRTSLAAKKSKDVSLALQTNKYNEAFWKNYNVIKENPADKEIVEFFEQAERIDSKSRKRTDEFLRHNQTELRF